MKHSRLLFLSLLLLGADEPKKDKDLLQGEWVMQSLEVEGVPVPEEKLKGTTLLIQGDKYTVITKKSKREVSFKLDQTKNVKTIDMALSAGKEPEIGKGIYKLEGDVFTLCRALDSTTERPKEFTTAADSGVFKVIWKRKAKEPSK